VQHWVLVLSFTSLVVTGFPIKFADKPWASWMIDLLGGLSFARHLHRYAGVVLIIGFFYHLSYVFYTAWVIKLRTKQGWLKTFMGLPMMSNPQELKHLFQQIAFLLFLRKTRPEGDRFTLKEKFEYFGVFWGSALLGVTGMLMWFNAWTTDNLTGRVLTVAMVVHSFEAFLALLHVGVIHMIGVILAPQSFPISPAMFTGDTPVEEMAEAHGAMVEQAAARVLGTEKGGERRG
jgi:cytochrome b subunit of formate dehydrogenase